MDQEQTNDTQQRGWISKGLCDVKKPDMKTTHCVIPDDFEIAQSFQGTRDGRAEIDYKASQGIYWDKENILILIVDIFQNSLNCILKFDDYCM